MRASLLFFFITLTLTLAACASSSNGNNDDLDVDIEPAPTDEPSPTTEPKPAEIATPESNQTPAPAPSPTPEPEETLEPSPTPEDDREQSTLTGESMSDPPPRPIAVRIDNSPNARPHTGMAEADLVYEAPTEASVTRFLAFYQTTEPEVVGPTRSARLMDVDVVPLHDAILAYSGASTGVQERLWQRGLPLLVLEGNASAASWRESSRSAPHNLYTSIPDLRDVANDHGWSREAENDPFTFGDAPDNGLPGSSVDIPYIAGHVAFSYNAETDSYDRFVESEESRDVETDEIISPRNVIVMWAPFFVGDIPPNTRGEISNDVDLYGSGDAWLLRNGERFEVEWQRDEESEPFRFFDLETGEEVALAEGQTWINLLPEDMRAETEE